MNRARIVALASGLLLVLGLLAVVAHDPGPDDTSVRVVGLDDDLPEDPLDEPIPDLSLQTTTTSVTVPTVPEVTAPKALRPPRPLTSVVGAPVGGGSTCAGAAPAADATGIWLVDMASGSLRRVLAEPVEAYRWSPNGTRIAYVTRATRDSQVGGRLGVVDVATAQAKTLFDGPASAPAWSADSRGIAFLVRTNAKSTVATVHADGGAHRVLHETDNLLGALDVSIRGQVGFTEGGRVHVIDLDGSNKRELTRNTANVHDLLFSPDGTRVAYTDKQLVIQEVDDLDEARASSTGAPGRAQEWAADNSRVAFLRIDENGRPRGIATRADGAYPQDVAAAGGFSMSPAGDRLVSADDRGPAAKLRITDVGTHAERVVAEGLWQPTWSTRGEDIATLGMVPGTKANFVCIVQGKAQRRVANLPGPPPYGTFEWSPSGTTLAFLTF